AVGAGRADGRTESRKVGKSELNVVKRPSGQGTGGPFCIIFRLSVLPSFRLSVFPSSSPLPLRRIEPPDHRPEGVTREGSSDGEDAVAAADGHGPVSAGNAVAIVHGGPRGIGAALGLRGKQLGHVGGRAFDGADDL